MRVPFIASVRLAVPLLILLAAVVFVGTVLPQKPLVGESALIDEYGRDNYELMSWFGLTDVFHSWWFVVLMVLLAANLGTASFLVVFPRARKAWSWPRILREAPKQPHASLSGERWQHLIQTLRRRGWQVRGEVAGGSIVARKGNWHRLGPSVTHVGILIVLVGAFASLLWGFNGALRGVPGDWFLITDEPQARRSNVLVMTSPVFHGPVWLGSSPDLEVKIVDTWRQLYEDETPKQWFTELEFPRRGDHRTTASVNDPVRFRGVDFYQADWRRVLEVHLNDKRYRLPLDSIEGAEVAYVPAAENLGLLFRVPQKGESLQVLSVFGKGRFRPLATLSPDSKTSVGPMQIEYEGVFSETGLQYKYSPGDWPMLIGMGILVAGVLLAFGAKRLLWAVRAGDDIAVVAVSDRSKSLFVQEFRDLIAEAGS